MTTMLKRDRLIEAAKARFYQPEQRQKVVQFAVEQARPAAGRLELRRKRQGEEYLV